MGSAASGVEPRVEVVEGPDFNSPQEILGHQTVTLDGLPRHSEMVTGGPTRSEPANTGYPDCIRNGVRVVECSAEQLRPHPALAEGAPGYVFQKQLFFTESGLAAHQWLVTITQHNYILEGYDRWRLAVLQKRARLTCLELQMTQEEALIWLVQKHGRTNGLNDFVRVLLTLELEPWFKERAKSNQRLGGQMKASSNLTQAERIDVRSEIAAAAGVSIGNVTKVKQLLARSSPELIDALREGQIRIHKAWEWSKVSRDEQVDRLQQLRRERGITATINSLLARHRSRRNPEPSGLRNLLRAIAELRGDRRLSPLLGQIDDLLARIQGALSTPQDAPSEE